jgi:predicted transcriptional regulator
LTNTPLDDSVIRLKKKELLLNEKNAVQHLFNYHGNKKQELYALVCKIVKNVSESNVEAKIKQEDVGQIDKQDLEKFRTLLTEIDCTINVDDENMYTNVIHPLYWLYFQQGK